MKIKLLDYLACPVCRENSFILSKTKEERDTIEEGDLTCRKCSSVFTIRGGIIQLYSRLSYIAEKEKKSHEQEALDQKEKLNFQNEEWLLNFPDVEMMGVDGRTERIRRLISENTASGLKKIIKLSDNLILEIGAANCWVTARLALNNYCIALDILNSPPNGLEAGGVFIKNKNIYFERVLADMVNLPFKPAIFDYVVISSSLHHSPEIKKTLRQIHELLKPDGKLALLNEPCKGFFWSDERKRADIDVNSGFNEARPTINEWKKLFASGNFKSKIFLPANLPNVLRTRGGIYNKISIIFKFPYVKRITEIFFTDMLLMLFDGYFTAVLDKNIIRK